MNQERERNGDELSFSEAMEELERILRGVEAEETDIDVLGAELKRAAELLELCRTKIRRAEVEVTQIVQSLEEDTGQGDGTDASQDETDDNGSDELPF
jgi:exodeoxyribonuclease VII small subunit